MKRTNLLIQLDGLLENCKTCTRPYGAPDIKCAGCEFYPQIRAIGENLGRKKEMAKITLEEYRKLSQAGMADKEIAQQKGMNVQYLSQMKKKWNIRPVLGSKPEKKPLKTGTTKEVKKVEIEHMETLPVLDLPPLKEDVVNQPSHYHQNGIDVIGFSELQFKQAELKGFYRINILKYVTRYDRKNKVQDLEKAKFYLNKLIALEEGHDSHSNKRLNTVLELQEENLKLAYENAKLKGETVNGL